MGDKIKISGKYKLTIHRKNGSKEELTGKNMVVSLGLAMVINLLAGASTDKPLYMANGTDGTTPVLTQTALIGTENGREAMTNSPLGSSVTFSTTFNASADWIIREFGLFTAAVAGTMFSRFICQQFTLYNGEAVDVSWTLEVE